MIATPSPLQSAAPDGGAGLAGLRPDGHPRQDGRIALSTLGINLLSLALPVMTLQIYDRILPHPQSGTLPMLMAGVSLAIVLEACLRLARGYAIGWNGASYEYRMASAAMRHMLAASIPGMRSAGAGEQLHRMSAIGKLRDFYNGYLAAAAVDLAFVPVFLGFIAYVAGPLVVVPAALLMAFTLLSLAQGQRLRRSLKSRDAADDRRYDFLIETLDNIHTLKSLTLEKAFSRRYEALEETSARANYDTAEETADAFNSCTTMSHVMIAATIAVGAVLVLDGHITSGALVATLLLSGRMMQMIQRSLVLWLKYQDSQAARDKIHAIFDIPVTRGAREETGTPVQGRLQAHGLHFALPDGGKVIDGISMELKAGDCISVTGGNASGKTTLLNLLSGIITPDQGDISVDGANILRYPTGELSRHVGYITSNPVIFRGTIRNNLTRFGEIQAAAARKYAGLLGIDRDVAKLPLGYDTFLQGNSSDVVPPGLKQRIAMARVLAAQPKVILYDEAESQLDREGRRMVIALLSRLRESCALVLVSDDPDIRQLAARHFRLESGQLSPLADIQASPPPFDAARLKPAKK